MKTINLKAAMPTVDEARRRLLREIKAARTAGIRCLKLIHGWGSTGRGGALGPALHKSLGRRICEGRVEAFIPGERFGHADAATRALAQKFPALRNDSDFNRRNPGITIVILRK